MTKPLVLFRSCVILMLSISPCLIGCSNGEIVDPVAKESLPAANARPSNSGEGRELDVDGIKVNLVMGEGEMRDAFLAQLMPEVWLVDKGTGERVNLSSESQRILKEYWIESLSNRFCTEIDKGGATQRIQCDTRLTRHANKVGMELQKHMLTVNGVGRTIYVEESHNLIRYMGIAAADLVEELKRREPVG